MTSEVTYLGDLRTRAVHISSGSELFTDAPPDNQGRGEAFSPTDLAATSLASCMLTIMGIAARTHHINMDGARATVTKIMAAAPRRIAAVEITFHMPALAYTEHERVILTRAALTCPVALSLHPDLEQRIGFEWPVPSP